MPAVLQGVPAEWLDDGLLEAVRRRDAVREADGAVAAATRYATERRDGALAALLEGDVRAVGDLVAASSELIACETARGFLPGTDLPSGVATEALRRAGDALSQAQLVMSIDGLDFDQQSEQWKTFCRQSGRFPDPPYPSDADRAVTERRPKVAAEVERWRRDAQTLARDAASAATDPLALLAAAAGLLGQSVAICSAVENLNRRTAEANQFRAQAGLGWKAA